MASFTVSFSIRDADGDTSTISMNLNSADMASAVIRAETIMPLIDAIILGRIEDCKVAQNVLTATFTKAVPVAGSDNEVKGRFIFDSAGGYNTRVSLPSFDKNTWTVVGGAINTTNGNAVDAFVDEVIGNGWADFRFADVTALKAAYEAFGR
jgi:hypothetical protein